MELANPLWVLVSLLALGIYLIERRLKQIWAEIYRIRLERQGVDPSQAYTAARENLE